MNENQSLPRTVNGRAKRKLETGRKNIFVKNAIKPAKRRKNIYKNKKLEIELIKIEYANISTKLEYELKVLNKSFVNDLSLYENKNIFFVGEYTGDLELIGTLVIGKNVRNTHNRFGNITEY